MIGGLRLDDDPRPRDDDQFPVGMRVLVVDDDRTCLLDLEAMLLNCHYHVTSSSHPGTALRLLREEKGEFDLVMTDVDMPDIDGFKFLQLVRYVDKDLPVILLSTSGDTKVVMKGISNGACDYLLKPVRVEQLKLIWQHVFRRRTKDSKTSSLTPPACCCASAGPLSTRKRRKQNDDNKDLSTTKSSPTQPKAVMSVEMWRKFRAAVHQLGSVNKVEPEPEKIVDLMNVEGRTRKNEASQIQHYRLYLRGRANAMAAFRASQSSSYLPMVDADADAAALGKIPELMNQQKFTTRLRAVAETNESVDAK